MKSSKKEKIQIAYFILVHRYPEQFKRLFRAIYHPDNHYLIHIDKKAEMELYEGLTAFLSEYPNTYLLDRENVLWGGYSMVQAELSGIDYLLNINAKWDFFINLSGQDFPLKPQEFIQDFLRKNQGCNFIRIADQAKKRPETMNRIENYFNETNDGFSGIPYKRPYLRDVTPYIGGQWMILSRACCEFICESNELQQFKDYYINTLIPDEGFFQTILMNTTFKGNITNDDKRAIIWIPDGNIKLRPKTLTNIDLTFLLNGDNLFARKFDDKIDSTILNILEESFYSHNHIDTQHKTKHIEASVSIKHLN